MNHPHDILKSHRILKGLRRSDFLGKQSHPKQWEKKNPQRDVGEELLANAKWKRARCLDLIPLRTLYSIDSGLQNHLGPY